MNIAVIGSGYVGLITGLCLSSKGNNVRCIDVNKKIVEKINNGIPNFHEDGLKKLLNKELNSKRFFSYTKLNKIDFEIDIIIIAVGTPSNIEGEIDLSFIKDVSNEVGIFLKSVIIKSHIFSFNFCK